MSRRMQYKSQKEQGNENKLEISALPDSFYYFVSKEWKRYEALR